MPSYQTRLLIPEGGSSYPGADGASTLVAGDDGELVLVGPAGDTFASTGRHRSDTHKIFVWDDLYATPTTAVYTLFRRRSATGTVVEADSTDPNHQGIWTLRAASTGGVLGCTMGTAVTHHFLGAYIYETCIYVHRTTNIKGRFGWFPLNTTADPTTCIQFRIDGGSLYGYCSTSSSVNASTSTYTVQEATWYTLQIRTLPDRSGVVFSVRDDSGALLFHDTILGTSYFPDENAVLSFANLGTYVTTGTSYGEHYSIDYVGFGGVEGYANHFGRLV